MCGARVEELEGRMNTFLPKPSARHKSGVERERDEIMNADVDLMAYTEGEK